MNKKIILTSFIALGFACPVMAESFPSDGLMQENKTYDNAATESNMAGVYEGSIYANAQYTDTQYTVNAGEYLPANAEAVATCIAGSFCPGLQSPVTYSTTEDQGLNACPNGYTNSAAGATSADECYTACTVANANIAHASAVSGNDYYGNGIDTCEPTACVLGYHVRPAGTPNLTTLIGVAEAGTGHTANNSTGSGYETNGMSNSVISGDPMAFAVDYGTKGIMIKGHGRCSTRAGTDPWTNNTYNVIEGNIVETLDDETGTGQYCYCQLDSYTPNGGSTVSLSAPWMFFGDGDDANYCALVCARNCATRLRYVYSGGLAFRAAVFGSLGPSPAMCEANTITINWNGTTQAAIDANNAGVATYDGDIRTPASASHIPGKTFTGWRFSTTAPSNGN